jgi:hypothetical protein
VPLWFVRNLEVARALLIMAGCPVSKTKMRLLFVQVLLENGSGSGRARQHCGVAKSNCSLGSTSSEARGAHDGIFMQLMGILFLISIMCWFVFARHSLRAMSRSGQLEWKSSRQPTNFN